MNRYYNQSGVSVMHQVYQYQVSGISGKYQDQWQVSRSVSILSIKY